VANVLEIIPLGGIGEFGMNCTLMRFGDEMIIIDAGMGFPEESAYGVDVCIPDFEILEQYRDEITADHPDAWSRRSSGRVALCAEENQRAGLSVALSLWRWRKASWMSTIFSATFCYIASSRATLSRWALSRSNSFAPRTA
jgi:hypothetical protein